MNKKHIPVWKGLIVFCATFYCISVTLLYFFQTTLIFRPDETFATPQERQLEDFRLVKIKTSDNETLNAWYKEPSSSDVSSKFILFFHGNGLSLANKSQVVANLNDYADGMLSIDYRGYGGSTGSPSAEGLYEDARSAVSWLKQNNIDMRNVVVVSYSIGTAVGAQTAATEPVAAAIFMAPYSSIADVAQFFFPIVPVRYLLNQDMDAIAEAKAIKAPILVIHGSNDWIIPYKFGKKFFDAFPSQKEMVTLDGQGHGFAFTKEGLTSIKPFLEKLAPLQQQTEQSAP